MRLELQTLGPGKHLALFLRHGQHHNWHLVNTDSSHPSVYLGTPGFPPAPELCSYYNPKHQEAKGIRSPQPIFSYACFRAEYKSPGALLLNHSLQLTLNQSAPRYPYRSVSFALPTLVQ